MVDDGDGNGERESRMEKKGSLDLLVETADEQGSEIGRVEGRKGENVVYGLEEECRHSYASQ
jgi:hypothetical protein